MLPAFSLGDLKKKQQVDETLACATYYVERKLRPSRREREHETVNVQKRLKHWEKLDGILYWKSKDKTGKKRLFWVGMDEQLKDYVMRCRRCVVSKSRRLEARAPLQLIKTSALLELVCIDFWSAEGKDGESIDVLVVTDHFTKVAHAFPCTNQTAKQVAQKLWNNFFCLYGFPQRLLSDQGANFESKLISELMDLAGVKKFHTTPCHPMCNGQTERFNCTLRNMIRALPPQTKVKWPQMIQTLMFVYNCTVHETTRFAPFYLVFGRTPQLPVDAMFGSVLRDETVLGNSEFVDFFQRDLQKAVHVAQKNTSKAQKKQAREYDKKVRR